VNACSFSGFCEGAVLNPKNHATSVARVIEAALPLRFFAVPGSLKVRTLSPQQRGSLFGFGLFRSYAAKPRLPKLFSHLGRAFVPAVSLKHFAVPLAHMFRLRQAFQVIGSIVRFVSVNMMHLFVRNKVWQPALRHHAMQKLLTADRQVAVGTQDGLVKGERSENFPASRYGVQVIEQSKLDSVCNDAVHGVTPKVIRQG
jgi:hypothetical protein